MISIKQTIQSTINAETLRDRSMQRKYLERSRRKLDYIVSVHSYNVIDSFYMIEEGDDSHILTKAGLYQLEYDCMNESEKPIPYCVKTFSLYLMKLVIVLSMVYVTLIGGQLSTIQIQEWVCYYLGSLAMFGFVLEPIRAVIIAWLMNLTSN